MFDIDLNNSFPQNFNSTNQTKKLSLPVIWFGREASREAVKIAKLRKRKEESFKE